MCPISGRCSLKHAWAPAQAAAKPGTLCWSTVHSILHLHQEGVASNPGCEKIVDGISMLQMIHLYAFSSCLACFSSSALRQIFVRAFAFVFGIRLQALQILVHPCLLTSSSSSSLRSSPDDFCHCWISFWRLMSCFHRDSFSCSSWHQTAKSRTMCV